MDSAEGQRKGDRDIEVMLAKYWWYDDKGNKIPWFRPAYEAGEFGDVSDVGSFGDVGDVDSEPARHEYRLEQQSPSEDENHRTGSSLAHCDFML